MSLASYLCYIPHIYYKYNINFKNVNIKEKNVGWELDLQRLPSQRRWHLLFTQSYYYDVGSIHNGFEKTTKHLLNGIIDFISFPCSCGFKGCHLLHREILLLSLCFPCGTHIIFILQKNKCILTIKCHALLLITFFLFFFHVSLTLKDVAWP